jgi:hypothetical protein
VGQYLYLQLNPEIVTMAGSYRSFNKLSRAEQYYKDDLALQMCLQLIPRTEAFPEPQTQNGLHDEF